MCGIAGIIGEAPSRDTVERMTQSLSHRGPDDQGVWAGPGACLGHSRLSILDLSSAGHQPMSLGPLTIVYNGEIYNFRALRSELPGPFRSETDTEVLLHLYERDGEGMVDALCGMFAFAIWDERQRRLFAARDRLGIKPFFYRETADGLAFASEIKALVEMGRPPLEPTALSDYFAYNYIPHPKTIYSGIRKLPPAHRLVWDGKTGIDRYWTPSAEVTRRDPDQACEELGSMLATIVPEHTIADVPVGVFLSGGIDSTTVVGHLDRPRTFTMGIEGTARDERLAGRLVADHFETEHHEDLVTALDIEEALDLIPRLYDEPFGDNAAWPTWLVSKMARRHVKVTLSGEGGDELFLGYGYHSTMLTHRSTPLKRLLTGLLPPFSKFGQSLQRRAATGVERYVTALRPFTPRQKRALFTPEFAPQDYDDLWHVRRFWREDLEILKRLQWADIHTHLPGAYLTKVDRASMAHSLEVRPPLLDHRVVEFALSLDPALLRDVEGGRGKLILRRLMANRVPPGLFDLPKRGFGVPAGAWTRKRPALLRGALERLRRAGIVRRDARVHLRGNQTWLLLVLDRWMDQVGLL